MKHQSVLLHEALVALNINHGGRFIDCTFGRGGHSQAIMSAMDGDGYLLAIDKDPAALMCQTVDHLKAARGFEIRQGSFAEVLESLADKGWVDSVDGILMDLGVSSPQLDDASRGFSFMRDGPLDMRMNPECGLSAAQWLNQVEESELVRVLFEYGEERYARRIAKAISQVRQTDSILTTKALADLVARTVPGYEKHKHPATRTFQAIRIAINNELDEIKRGLNAALVLLKPGGRLVIISFHSLEDRLVKQFFKQESGVRHDPGRLPVKQTELEQGRLIKMGKPVKAGLKELEGNPRARSAIMRIAEKV
jgi:16S rRNA (cytosine1402-N4)-methyltransferase